MTDKIINKTDIQFIYSIICHASLKDNSYMLRYIYIHTWMQVRTLKYKTLSIWIVVLV